MYFKNDINISLGILALIKENLVCAQLRSQRKEGTFLGEEEILCPDRSQ